MAEDAYVYEAGEIDRMVTSVGRELGLRKGCYPRWVENGRMKQKEADDELESMSMVYKLLKGLKEGKFILSETQRQLFP